MPRVQGVSVGDWRPLQVRSVRCRGRHRTSVDMLAETPQHPPWLRGLLSPGPRRSARPMLGVDAPRQAEPASKLGHLLSGQFTTGWAVELDHRVLNQPDSRRLAAAGAVRPDHPPAQVRLLPSLPRTACRRSAVTAYRPWSDVPGSVGFSGAWSPRCRSSPGDCRYLLSQCRSAAAMLLGALPQKGDPLVGCGPGGAQLEQRRGLRLHRDLAEPGDDLRPVTRVARCPSLGTRRANHEGRMRRGVRARQRKAAVRARSCCHGLWMVDSRAPSVPGHGPAAATDTTPTEVVPDRPPRPRLDVCAV